MIKGNELELNDLPYQISIEFDNYTKITVLNGGFTDLMLKSKNINNIESLFVNNIDDKPWHESYNNEFGYIISNNPITDNEPKLYWNSMQIGNINNLYGQEINKYGLQNTILLY